MTAARVETAHDRGQPAAELLDDGVPGLARDNALVDGVDMARRMDEARALGPDALVLVQRHHDALAAGWVVAFAEELSVLDVVAVGSVRDPLVDVSEQRLDLADSFFGGGHSESFNGLKALSVTDRIGAVQTLRRTPLYERHAALGARLVPFAGWEMPVQYASIVEEHKAVRTSAGVFDVSHMGQLSLPGPGAHEYLQARLSNDLDRIGEGEAQYTLLTNERGGITDDLIAYRRGEDDYLLVVNASNVEADHAALQEAEDVSSQWALLAVQGPEALDRLGIEVEPFTFREDEVLGTHCLIAGTGYTGERGCELGCAPDDAPALWDAVVSSGIVPCGLGARDTLRLEVCYPLHGNDITPDRTPIEAGLGWPCALDKDFTGVEVLRRQKQEGPAERLVAFVMDEKAIPRHGMPIVEGGEVTSGSLSPMLGLGIGLGYVPFELGDPGSELRIDVRGRPKGAHVVKKPIYRREES
jgi:aminomethyltransferase